MPANILLVCFYLSFCASLSKRGRPGGALYCDVIILIVLILVEICRKKHLKTVLEDKSVCVCVCVCV